MIRSALLAVTLSLAFSFSAVAQTPSTAPTPTTGPSPALPSAAARLPGRCVKVAAIAIGFGGKHDFKLKLGLDHLATAGQQGCDIACLPEEFTGTKQAETIPGPTTDAVGAVARQYHMYVICPIRESAGEVLYNTAVLIDRSGKIVGQYRKIFPVWGEKVCPASEGVRTFDLDFGRISILTCFDLNFPELWQEADRLGAEIVFWPSAYGGGAPLNGMASIYNYYIVPVGRGNLIDMTGQTLQNVQSPREKQFIATFDLDRVFIHKDFNKEKVAKLLKEHAGEVEIERDCDMEGWYHLRSIKAGVLVRELCKQYQIETLWSYRQRSRQGINELRKEKKPV